MTTSPVKNACIRALILNRRHHCLLVRRAGALEAAWELPIARVPWPERPLSALKDALMRQLGIELPNPAGSSVPEDGASPRDFAFILQEPSSGEAIPLAPDPAEIDAVRWFPLSQAIEALRSSKMDEQLWRLYTRLILGGFEPPRRALDVFYFGNTPEMAAKLAHLVTKGEKRWTSCFIAAAEADGDTLPFPGLLSVVTDYFGYPLCLIETVEVRRVPFGQVGADVAAGEGEGDLTYDFWREVHLRFFSQEARAHGLEFSDDSLLLNERFRVLKVLGTES